MSPSTAIPSLEISRQLQIPFDFFLILISGPFFPVIFQSMSSECTGWIENNSNRCALLVWPQYSVMWNVMNRTMILVMFLVLLSPSVCSKPQLVLDFFSGVVLFTLGVLLPNLCCLAAGWGLSSTGKGSSIGFRF